MIGVSAELFKVSAELGDVVREGVVREGVVREVREELAEAVRMREESRVRGREGEGRVRALEVKEA